MSRTSHEVRGLKYDLWLESNKSMKSHLTRGAWIEIPSSTRKVSYMQCRTSHEVRGLKYSGCQETALMVCRTSHEVRGLKWLWLSTWALFIQSHLTRGAWIEI